MLNNAYASDKVKQQAKNAFNDNPAFPNISLSKIFDSQSYTQLQQAITSLTFTRVSKPLECEYSKSQIPQEIISKIQNCGILEFASFLLDKKFKKITSEAFKLVWKDYSMLLDTQDATKATYDIIINLTDDWPQNAGASIVYIAQNGEPLELPATGNSIIILKRTKGTRSFFKYANHYAEKPRYFICGTLS